MSSKFCFELPQFSDFPYSVMKGEEGMFPCYYADGTLHYAVYPRGDFCARTFLDSKVLPANITLHSDSFRRNWMAVHVNRKDYLIYKIGHPSVAERLLFWTIMYQLFHNGFTDTFVSVCVPEELRSRYYAINYPKKESSLQNIATFFEMFFREDHNYGRDEINMILDSREGGSFLLGNVNENTPPEILALVEKAKVHKEHKVDYILVHKLARDFLCSYFNISIEAKRCME